MAMQTEVDSQEVAAKREAARLKAIEAREAARAVTYVADVVVEETTHVAGNIAAIIYDIFGVYGDKAVSVASCESGLDPNAVNGSSGAAGLFQLMPFHWRDRFDPFDPVANARYAFGLSDGGTNWGAWSGACA